MTSERYIRTDYNVRIFACFRCGSECTGYLCKKCVKQKKTRVSIMRRNVKK